MNIDDFAATSRTCTICKIEKPFRDFYWDSTRGRWKAICKKCEALQKIEYRKTHKPIKKVFGERPLRKQTGILYFVLAPDVNRVKIGKSQEGALERRVKGIQAHSPIDVVLIATINTDDAIRLERRLHVVFQSFWIHSEWFKYTPEIENFIKLNAVKRNERYEVANGSISAYNGNWGD